MSYDFGLGLLLGMFVMYVVLDIINYKQIKKYDVVLKLNSPALKIIVKRIQEYKEQMDFLKRKIANEEHVIENADQLRHVDWMLEVLNDIKAEIAGVMWDIDRKTKVI